LVRENPDFLIEPIFLKFEIPGNLYYDWCMKKELKELIILDGMVEAEIIKTKLESQGIPSYIKFESVGRLFGITMNGLGQVRIMVPGEYYSEAKGLIKKNKRNPEKK
jgi:hypothetical protein